MAETGLKILDNNPNGFFVLIEGGKIDWACHDNNIERMVFEVIGFNEAVKAVCRWSAGRDDTLVIIAADHETGGLEVLNNNGKGVMPTVRWKSKNHTDALVDVYAAGAGADGITGLIDNTDIFDVMAGCETRRQKAD